MNTRRIILKGALLVLFCSGLSNKSQAQAEGAKQSLVDIYKVYDNMKDLSFDVQYTFDTDTLFGNHTHDELKGNYTMNGKQVLYTLGDIDFMQNDSFLVAVYNKERFIIVSNPQPAGAGGMLPMRAQLDSLFANAADDYEVNMGKENNSTVISFKARKADAPMGSFIVRYNTGTHYLEALKYSFTGVSETYNNEPEDVREKLQGVPRKHTLNILFSNYKKGDALPASSFDEKNYILSEGSNYRPVGKYAEFTVQNARIKF